MVTEQHQYISILTDEGGRMSDGSRGGCRRNQKSSTPKEYDGYVVYPEVRLWRTTKYLSWDICRY